MNKIFDAKDARIFWREQKNMKIDMVLVLEYVNDDPKEHQIELVNACHMFENSSGNCSSEWLVHPKANPESLYAQWTSVGFKDHQRHIWALKQLAQIRECEWARKLLASFHVITPCQS